MSGASAGSPEGRISAIEGALRTRRTAWFSFLPGAGLPVSLFVLV